MLFDQSEGTITVVGGSAIRNDGSKPADGIYHAHHHLEALRASLGYGGWEAQARAHAAENGRLRAALRDIGYGDYANAAAKRVAQEALDA